MSENLKPGETSKRLLEDSYARLKCDATSKQDETVIDRVEELAEKHSVSMTEISLAWLLTKVTAPVVGATNPYDACYLVILDTMLEH